MRTVITAVLMIAVVATLVGVANAGPINRREHRQIERIVQGVRSGELTFRETTRLLGEEARIRAEEFRFRHSGGGLNPRERLRLERDLNHASRDIFRLKHNGRHR